MGLRVSPAEAARLIGKSERTVRQWIRSGKLHAEPAGSRPRRPGVGPYRWLVDIDELGRVPGVALDPARLAEANARAASADAAARLLERVTQLEKDVAQLRHEFTEIKQGFGNTSADQRHC